MSSLLPVLILSTFLILCNGQTLRRPRTCSLEQNEPEVVSCRKMYGTPQTCELTNEIDGLHTIYDSTEWARNCDCGSLPYMDYYCPMVADVCHVPRWRSYQPTPRAPICRRHESRHEEFSKSIWPVLVVVLSCIFACLMCSRSGHQSICLMVGVVAPMARRAYATYLLRHRHHQASFLIRRWVRRREERLRERYQEIMNGMNQETTLTSVEETLLRDAIAHNRQGRPHMLKLRTRTFLEKERSQGGLLANRSYDEHNIEQKRSDSSANDDDFNDDVDADFDGCMICFGPLCEGDRVGSLRCNHVFHSKCLKIWYELLFGCLILILTLFVVLG